MSKVPVFVILAALAATTGAAFPASSAAASRPDGPCFAADTTLELIATGECRCANGSCVVLDCKSVVGVGANLEALKGQLKATLTAKATAMNGELIGEVKFELRVKP